MNWFRRLFGSKDRHRCEEFTRWTTREKVTHRAPTEAEKWRGGVHTLIKETARFQERECTICGKLEQREIR